MELQDKIREIGERAGFEALGVAAFDYESGRSFDLAGDRWFHAASVIKVAVLLALFKAAETGTVRLDDPLHVRNRFRSISDGSSFSIEGERDGDQECHGRIGRTMKLCDLARAMIVRSSNLATNLLLDWLGLDTVQRWLGEAEITGVKIVRGVEDTVAFQAGLNNEMTPCGAIALFRRLCEDDFLGETSRQQMRDILLAQEFNSMIPARLPSALKIAHKTGEISTHCHDAGVIYFPDRQPLSLAIFTQCSPNLEQRHRPVAEIAAAIFEEFTT